MLLKRVKAKNIKDSRSDWTIEVSVNGCKASSPSGKSKGKYETPSFRKSLNWNIKILNSLNFPNINISSFNDILKVESFLKRKFKLKNAKQFGANTLFALESAVLKALAKEKNIQLFQLFPKPKKIPVPVGNAIGGGLHSHNKNKPIFQEFLLIPKEKKFKDNIKVMDSIYQQLKKQVQTNEKNDEGAWQTPLNNEQVLKLLSQQKNIRVGIDAAASSFYNNKYYNYRNKQLNTAAQVSYIHSLIKQYNLFYIEDPLQEEDFQGFAKVMHSPKHLIVGDDLTATQISRLKKAIKTKSINAMIIKPNQNGSLIELKQIFDICKKHK
ncbi:MAG: hypothetical protein KKD94_04865, partial [Nanoarchaeota archaeon]|nr:hypothetical protein [Nanoarchaeota archaeon]MBU1988782.1 hypothetical protein [Nanoarchaeota archaeon]